MKNAIGNIEVYKFNINIEIQEDNKYKKDTASNVTLDFATDLENEAIKNLIKMDSLVRMQVLGNAE